MKGPKSKNQDQKLTAESYDPETNTSNSLGYDTSWWWTGKKAISQRLPHTQNIT